MMRVLNHDRTLWVSPTGSDNNPGTSDRPFRTIQKAVDAAVPGTAVMVREGTYRENVTMGGASNHANLSRATADKPVWLVSADGVGKAVIESADPQKSGVLISVGHMRLYDFEVRGSAWNVGDHAPIKVVTSNTVHDADGDIILDGNIIAGTGRDLVKAHMVHGLQVTNNRFVGTAFEDLLDCVTVWDVVISNNVFDGRASRAINVKTGSKNVDIENNLIVLESAYQWPNRAIVELGGDGFSQAERPPLPPEFRGFEAKDVRFVNNVVTGDGVVTVSLRGAVGTVVEGNVLWGQGRVAVSSQRSASPEADISRDNTIRNNVHRHDMIASEVQPGQGGGLVVGGNRSGDENSVNFRVGPDDVLASTLDLAQGPGGAGGIYDIVVRAGAVGGPTAPRFALIVDGVSLGERDIRAPITGHFDVANPSNYQDYTFRWQGRPPTDIDIAFLNQGWDHAARVSRNLFIDYIKINGVRFEAEHFGRVESADNPGGFFVQRNGIFHPGQMSFDHLYLSPRWPDPEPDLTLHRIDVRVGGSGGAVKPAYEVWADGAFVGRGVVEGAGATPIWTLPGSAFETDSFFFQGAAPRVVSVVYVNDTVEPFDGIDRNLRVDRIAVNGVVHESETAAVYVRPGGGATTVVTGTEMMFWNGEMRFDLDGSVGPQTIVVRAAGTGAAAGPARFEVRVDGVVIGAAAIQNSQPAPFDASNRSAFRDYAFLYEGGPLGEIQVAFTNDGGAGTANRDLFVDHVTVGGARFETESAAVATEFTNLGVRTTAGTEGLFWNGHFTFDLG